MGTLSLRPFAPSATAWEGGHKMRLSHRQTRTDTVSHMIPTGLPPEMVCGGQGSALRRRCADAAFEGGVLATRWQRARPICLSCPRSSPLVPYSCSSPPSLPWVPSSDRR